MSLWPRRKTKKDKEMEQYNMQQKQAVQHTLDEVQKKTEEVDQRIEELRRIARLGTIKRAHN